MSNRITNEMLRCWVVGFALCVVGVTLCALALYVELTKVSWASLQQF